MKAEIYLNGDGYITFESERFFLKFVIPKQLNYIKRIVKHDNGYFVLDTNYGEEYIDLQAISAEVRLNLAFDNLQPVLRRFDYA